MSSFPVCLRGRETKQDILSLLAIFREGNDIYMTSSNIKNVLIMSSVTLSKGRCSSFTNQSQINKNYQNIVWSRNKVPSLLSVELLRRNLKNQLKALFPPFSSLQRTKNYFYNFHVCSTNMDMYWPSRLLYQKLWSIGCIGQLCFILLRKKNISFRKNKIKY